MNREIILVSKYLLSGGIFFLISTCSTSLLLYICNLGYWISSALTFIVFSNISYFINKNLVFNCNNSQKAGFVKFWMAVAICYIASYGVSRALIFYVISKNAWDIEPKSQELIAVLVAQIVYTVVNYILQRIWVFKVEKHL